MVNRKDNILSSLRNNAVTIMFVIMCAVCMFFSGLAPSHIMFELFSRMSRNVFIVLALIIPIVAGMGINFAITIGAMGAQIALLWVLEWGIPGVAGFAVAALMTVPIAGFFGYLVGNLLNKMKGQETIGSMILGYFANGLYQLLFLFIFGNLIPLSNTSLVIKGSVGVANTMDLSRKGGLKYALDGILKLPFEQALYVFVGCVVLYYVIRFLLSKAKNTRKLGIQLILPIVAVIAIQLPFMKELFSKVQVPMATFACVGVLCVFNSVIMKTKLGQQFRAVGQDRAVANSAGINVDRVRVIAIILSTILAGWGQLIFVQNMGSLQTYGAHEQVGLYAGAAILVGGASIVRATNTQALLGCVLFHLLFILAPEAGKNIFGDAAIGEYFRVTLSYGVIAIALAMHAWSGSQKRKPQNAIKAGAK